MSQSGFSHNNNQNLLGFVPAIVIDNLLEKIRKKEVRIRKPGEKQFIPEKQTFSSVVMFADISGFTNLSEKLSKKGTEGAELLAFALTRYMELLVKSIGKSGGDIFKFAGDAMIVIWPPPQNKNDDEELTTLCRQAIQSSLDIQSKLHEIKLVEDIKLSVKIGFGVGQLTILHVGGVYGRAEYLAAGDTLKEAFECEHLAPKGGYIIVSKKVLQRVEKFFKYTEMKVDGHEHGENGPFYKIDDCKKDQRVRMKADALLLNTTIKPSDIELIKTSLMSYIPAAVLPFIELNEEKWAYELRRLTVMFCNLGIDLSDAQSDKGLERIQEVIETVQNCVYKYQGSLNKLLMDDKGSTLMIIFGLYPMAHQDDPVRSVLTALFLLKELKKINCSCAIGITTGMVFAGVVGTSGSRREYSVLGDVVNLSARFMQAACKHKDKKILVDVNTKDEAQNKICFRFLFKDQVKGKTGDISFYEPIDIFEEEYSKFPFNIKTHLFSPQKGENIDSESYYMFGKDREEDLKKTLNFLEKFEKKPDHNYLILITGTYGIGKSLFLRNFVEKAYKLNENSNWKYSERTHIFMNSLNPSTTSNFFNGWCTILPKILMALVIRRNSTAENVINSLLEDDTELLNNVNMVSEIFNLHFKSKSSMNSELNKHKEKDIKIIKKIFFILVKKFLEETDDENTESNSMIASQNSSRKKSNSKIEIVSPLIIVLDDMQDYDVHSWSLTKKILKNLKKIFIVAAIRDSLCEIPPNFSKNKKAPDTKDPSQEENVQGFLSALKEVVEPAAEIKLKGLDLAETQQFIRRLYGADSVVVEEEKKEEEKNVEQKKVRNESINKENKKVVIEDEKKTIEKIMNSLILKCEGMPLVYIHFLKVLIDRDYLKLKDKKLIITQNLIKCLQMNQFLTIDPPLSQYAINGEILDRLDSESYLLMKTASVIGEQFSFQMLIRVNPFPLTLTNEKIKKLIISLEQQEILEVLDENEHDIIYRFSHKFMREIIYSRMIFTQRRQIHRYVAEAIQSNPLQHDENEDYERNNLVFHWCMAETLDPLSGDLKDSQFSNKAKRSLIVKKISNLLSKNQRSSNITVKSGLIEKKSDRGFSWSSRFIVLTTKELRYYYKEEDYRDKTEFALGVISLKHIFKIYYLNEKDSKKPYAFLINTGSWQKKNIDMGIREFYFAAKTFNLLEEWTTYIEFLRAKAIYEDFVSSFGKISFPLPTADKGESLDRGKINLGRNKGLHNFDHNNMIKQQSMNQRKASSRKTTLLKSVKNNLISDTEAEKEENQKKLKDCFMKFFTHSMAYLFSYLTEKSKTSKQGRGNATFGQTTTFQRKFPIFVDSRLISDPKKKNTISNESTEDNTFKNLLLSNENDNILEKEFENEFPIFSKTSRKSNSFDENLGDISQNINHSNFLQANSLDFVNSSLMNSSKSKINLEMIDEVDELNTKKLPDFIDKTSNFNQNSKFNKPSHFTQIKETLENQDSPISHNVKQRNFLLENEIIPNKTSDDYDDRNFRNSFDDDKNSNRKSSFKNLDSSFKNSEEKIENGFSIYEANEVKILRKFNIPPPRVMIERKEGNECLTEIAFKSKKRNINQDLSFYERQNFNHIKNNTDNENSSNNLFESIPTKLIIENFNIVNKESNEDLKLIDLEYERKKSISIISEQRGGFVDKEFSNQKDIEKNIFTFESKNSSGSLPKEEETKTSFPNNTNKIPKVMMRMAKNDESGKKREISDFQSSLPFSSFVQTFDRKKIEEEPRGNENYKKINIFKKNK